MVRLEMENLTLGLVSIVCYSLLKLFICRFILLQADLIEKL